jgi:hypothetical protein
MAYNAYASIDTSKIDPKKESVVQLGPTGGERFSLYGPNTGEWLHQKGAVGMVATRPGAAPPRWRPGYAS